MHIGLLVLTRVGMQKPSQMLPYLKKEGIHQEKCIP